MSTPKKPKSAPWFYRRDDCVARAVAYVEAHLKAYHAPGKHLYMAELSSFGESQTAKAIYESNLIENAGLSEGETRRLVLNYPNGDATYESGPAKHSVSDLSVEDQKSVQQLAETSAMQFEGKNRKTKEVLQHLQGINYANHNFPIRYLREIASGHQPPLFASEALLKNLQAVLSTGLLPDDCDVQPGQYRIHSVTTGDFNLIYPAPENLDACMANWVQRTNELMSSLMRSRVALEEMCRAAALISYEFVRIHPFPDFNGRTSRLLLTSVLRCFGVPFPVTLRGDKKGKTKYFQALKWANQSTRKIDRLETLIAMQVIEAFEAFEQNLVLAGLPPLLPPQEVTGSA